MAETPALLSASAFRYRYASVEGSGGIVFAIIIVVESNRMYDGTACRVTRSSFHVVIFLWALQCVAVSARHHAALSPLHSLHSKYNINELRDNYL